MKTVYKQTSAGWIRVRKCASFEHACKVALQLWNQTGIAHCVNN